MIYLIYQYINEFPYIIMFINDDLFIAIPIMNYFKIVILKFEFLNFLFHYLA
jgi:hypothetical protein